MKIIKLLILLPFIAFSLTVWVVIVEYTFDLEECIEEAQFVCDKNKSILAWHCGGRNESFYIDREIKECNIYNARITPTI